MQNEPIHQIFPDPQAIPEQFRIAAPIRQSGYLCDGAIRNWEGPLQTVHSPVCAAVPGGPPERIAIGAYPLLGEAQALEALEAACRAYDHGRGAWPTMPVEGRIRHVEDFLFRMLERREAVVRLLMWEIGKCLPDAQKEFDRTVDYIRDTIDALKELDRVSSRFAISQGVLAQIRRAPLGVVLCMGPFNYPLNETFTTLIPALIMGNCAIFKPPKLGVLLHAPLLEAFREAFPPGVINTVYGRGEVVAGPLMRSGRIDVLAFIGSSRVADSLRKLHPKPHRLRCVLGLEAKNSAIVLPDADLQETVRECLLGALSFNGQRCTALKMLFVHETIVDRFLAAMSAEMGTLRCGMPWEPGVQITPLPEEGKTAFLTAMAADAVSRGARIVNPGGGAVNGTFISPALLYPVGPGMRLYSEEQFGPLVPVASFADLETPVDYLIASDYGQQASIFGADPAVIARLIDPLVNQVCRLNINSQCQRGPDSFPFTGRKDSAEGTLSVSDALRAFSIRTLVAAKGNAANRRIVTAILRQRSSAFLSTDFIF
jgi:glyceraldehyde-3-phosphate dehydrogenase (NADP+)